MNLQKRGKVGRVEDSFNKDNTWHLHSSLNLEYSRFMCRLTQDLKSTDTWEAVAVFLNIDWKKKFEKIFKKKIPQEAESCKSKEQRVGGKLWQAGETQSNW